MFHKYILFLSESPILYFFTDKITIMKTKIVLEAMRFYAYHGVMPQERKVGNYFIVDLTLVAPLEKAVESDNLEYTILFITWDTAKVLLEYISKNKTTNK